MARGSSYGEKKPTTALTTPHTNVPRRATRSFQTGPIQEEEPERQLARPARVRRAPEMPSTPIVPAFSEPLPLARHRCWLLLLLLSFGCVVVGAYVLASVGMFLHPTGSSQLVN